MQLTRIWAGRGIPCSQLAAEPVSNGRFIVHAIDKHNPSQRFWWEVKALRADATIEVEPAKESWR